MIKKSVSEKLEKSKRGLDIKEQRGIEGVL
jgi:hypothetical protein